MEDLPARIERLSPERRALYQALRSAGSGGRPLVPCAHPDEPSVMSFAQRRLWFLHRLNPTNPAYNCPVPIRLRGPLDAQALTEGLKTIVKRHAVLRTTYEMRNGQPLQVVHRSRDAALRLVDLSAETAAAREAAVHDLIVADANRPFDLMRDAVIRAELIRLAEDDHVFMFDIHHIANDHASIVIFLDELSACYNAQVSGRTARLAALPIQYADYAIWQRDRIGRDPEGHVLWSYWLRTLSDLDPIDLPTDRLRPTELSHRGGLRHFSVPPTLTAQLREIGRAEETTLFTTLLAAFYVLLSRYSGRSDIAIGCSATGRDRPETRALIGFFVNTVVLRIKGGDDLSFRDLVRRVRAVVLEGFAHSEFPFDVLVERLNPHRSAAQIPLVPVMFTLDDTPEQLPAFHGLEAEVIEPSFKTAKFDLLVGARPRGGGIHGHFQFSSDLFDAATIDRMIGHYLHVLQQVAEAPDRPLAAMALMTDAEERRMLVEWNDTGCWFPAACLHQLFEAQVRAGERRAAVLTPDAVVSYAELNRAADALAVHLRAIGVGRDVLVTVYLEQSYDFVVAVLAVLKAGGAYVPLDPGRHSGAIGSILDELGSTVVIASRPVPGLRAGPCHPLWIREGASGPVDRPDIVSSPADLAYVICTSGSTGAPKAIALEHRGVVNNLTDINRRFAVGPDDRLMFLSSPAFDMSVYETLGVLVAGATVVVVAPEHRRAPWKWLDSLVDHQVTLWNSAPALLELLVEELERRGSTALPALRLALLGGDWVPVTLPERLRRFAPNVEFISLGGATEASIHSTLYPVRGSHAHLATIPYGRPMANQRTYILDRSMRPVPVGVPGELHLAGVGLARGYLRQPELTAEKFVHGGIRGARERMFKTGDEARWRDDGVIELLGRLDFQVKIHGQRVDLKAVEHNLRNHAAVRDAVVVARRDQSRRIVSLSGYVIPTEPQCFSVHDLRDYLSRSVPPHMVPSEFVALDRFPTNSSGKVDRLALSRIGASRTRPAAPPSDDLERFLLATWQSLLNRTDLGPNDDLFEFGCNSFKAIQAAGLIDRSMPVVEIFKNPTVRSLAAYLRSARATTPPRLHLLTPGRGSTPITLVCIPYGGGSAASYAALARAVPDNVAIWSAALPGHEPAGCGDPLLSADETVRELMEEIAARSLSPDIVYGHCAGAVIAVDLAMRLERLGHKLRAVCVGAALPDADPEASLALQRAASNADLQQHLASLGGFQGALDDAAMQNILAMARHDLVESARFFARNSRTVPHPLGAPLHCIFGTDDATTTGYEDRFREWQPFARSLRCVAIPAVGHYFVEQQAASLALVLGEFFRDARTEPAPGRAGAALPTIMSGRGHA